MHITTLLYGSVSERLGTTKSMNLIGIWTGKVLKWKSCKLKCKIIDYFHLTIFISVSAKELMRKKSKQNQQTLEELNSAHRRSQAKCQLIQTSYIKRVKLFLFFCHIINISLTELSRSVLENLDLGRVYYVRSVITISVKIHPYRPPARLIRANY